MCRRNQLLGMGLLGFGLGLVVACWLSSPFVCGCFGIAGALAGSFLLHGSGKRC